VVAHAGGIPFLAQVDGCSYRAAWFVDFVVRPEFQRRGLGIQLTEAWMKESDLCVTFCNELSMGVFRRFGWVETLDTLLHTIWVKPFEHPRGRLMPDVLRRTGDRLLTPGIDAFLRWRGGKDPHLETLGGDPSRDLVWTDGDRPDAVAACRDDEYVAWRIGASPDRDKYRIYCDGDVTMLVRLEGAVRRSVDVLWMSGSSASAPDVTRRMLASLALWAARHGRACVRYLPGEPKLASELRALGPVASRLRFAFWVREPRLLERLRSAAWRWQLIDSDFEWI
jgi:hypothetical protein